VLLLSVTIQSLDGFFFQPRIVGKSANLHPVAVILALLVGAQFGLGGLILAVPTMVIVRVLVKEFWWDNKVAEEAAEKSRPLSMESTENGSD
jgi:predicted PurR-regulated permease PerM